MPIKEQQGLFLLACFVALARAHSLESRHSPLWIGDERNFISQNQIIVEHATTVYPSSRAISSSNGVT